MAELGFEAIVDCPRVGFAMEDELSLPQLAGALHEATSIFVFLDEGSRGEGRRERGRGGRRRRRSVESDLHFVEGA